MVGTTPDSAHPPAVGRRREAYAAAACARCVKRKRKCIAEKAGRACKRCLESGVDDCSLKMSSVVWKREQQFDSSSKASSVVVISSRSYDAKLGEFSQASALGFHLISLHKRKLKGTKLLPAVRLPWPTECLRWVSFEETIRPSFEGNTDRQSDFKQMLTFVSMLGGARSTLHSQIIGPKPPLSKSADPWAVFHRPCMQFASVGALRRTAIEKLERDILQRFWILASRKEMALEPREVECIQLALEYIDTDVNADATRDARQRAFKLVFDAMEGQPKDSTDVIWMMQNLRNAIFNDAIIAGCRGLAPLATLQQFLTVFTPSEHETDFPPLTATDLEAIFPPTQSYEGTVALRLKVTSLLSRNLGNAVYNLFFATYLSRSSALLRSWDAMAPALRFIDHVASSILEHPYRLFLPAKDLFTAQLFLSCVTIMSLQFFQILVARYRIILHEKDQSEEVTGEAWNQLRQCLSRLSNLANGIFELASEPFGTAQFQALKGCGILVRYAVMVEPRVVSELKKDQYQSLRDGLNYAAYFSPEVSCLVTAIDSEPFPSDEYSSDDTVSPPTSNSDNSPKCQQADSERNNGNPTMAVEMVEGALRELALEI